jgi:hypothetical protein
VIDLGLDHPAAERLDADAELAGDADHGAIALAGLGHPLERQTDGALLQLRRIPPL